MIKDLTKKIEKHKSFLELKEVNRPLRGCCIGGWENMSRYINETDRFLRKGSLYIEDIDAADFIDIYTRYADSLNYDDDFIRTIEPFQSIPWTESAIGCNMNYTGKNIWSEPINYSIDEAYFKIINEDENASIKKYGEFLDFLGVNFAGNYPIGQAILRGPLDMAAAAVGEQNMIYNMIDRPNEMKKFISLCADIFKSFLKVHSEKSPEFSGGRVIGQYYIWTPGTCARLQEDVMSLLSRDFYLDFAMECDLGIAKSVQYSLFHLHASAFFLLDFVLRNEGIKIIQVSKDEGNTKLSDMIEGLQKIQAAGKCLLLKGRFTKEDYDTIGKKLDKQGLCVQVVVDSVSEADEALKAIDSM